MQQLQSYCLTSCCRMKSCWYAGVMVIRLSLRVCSTRMRGKLMDDSMTEPTDSQEQVGRLDLLLLVRSYNRREISYEESLRLSRAWAEAVISHCRPTDDLTKLPKPAAPG